MSVPRDFDKKITISKLRNYVKQFNLHLLAIDGIAYLTDERYRKGDPLRISLSNISEDLKDLSIELGIPILIVCQANRLGTSADDEDTPDVQHIKESDGIGAAATQIISLKQQRNTGTIIIEPKKGRSNAIGKKLCYRWDIDTGNFEFLSISESGHHTQEEEKPKKERKPRKSSNVADTF